MSLKKIGLIFGIMLLMMSIVFAGSNTLDDKGKSAAASKGADSQAGGTDSPPGLTNALAHVTNENDLAKLESNLEKFKENYADRMDDLEDVEVESIDEESGEMVIKAKENVKYFGLINGKATKRFNVNAEGAISEHAPWYSFLYSEVEMDESEEEEVLDESETEEAEEIEVDAEDDGELDEEELEEDADELEEEELEEESEVEAVEEEDSEDTGDTEEQVE